MIFVFLDDNSLDIQSNLEDVQKDYEGIDVENGIYEFFNEKGEYLKPIFTKPTIYTKELFGLFTTIQSGVYHLEIAKEINTNSFKKMLLSIEFLNENKYFTSIEEIRSKYII